MPYKNINDQKNYQKIYQKNWYIKNKYKKIQYQQKQNHKYYIKKTKPWRRKNKAKVCSICKRYYPRIKLLTSANGYMCYHCFAKKIL